MPATLRLLPLACLIAATPLIARPAPASSASAALSTANGTDAGYAVIGVERGKVVMTISLHGLSEGPHGLHLHTVGTCGAAGFTAAGGHLNPDGRKHGTSNPAGSHLGDLPNVVADAAGKASAKMTLTGTPKALFAALFDADGTAIVVHAGPDDYVTDPTGNSGGRIACGAFKAN